MSRYVFNGPAFLVGMLRSRAKLLRKLLNQHPCICINYIETEFLPYLISYWTSIGDVSNIKFPCLSCLHRAAVLFYLIYRADLGRIVSTQVWQPLAANISRHAYLKRWAV